MSKSRRLLEIMMTANRKRVFTAKELADEFNVSPRTIIRDLQELSEIGFPVYSATGPGGGYRVLNDRQLPPISFMENEAVAMFFASKSLEHYHSKPFKGEFSSALNKFYHHLPGDTKKRIDELHHRVEFRTPNRDLPSADLKLLLECAIQQQVLAVVYDSRDGETRRRIQPVGIYTENGFWYCPAYCFMKKNFRLFRTDRILAAEIAADQSERLDLSDITLANWKQAEPSTRGPQFHLKAMLNRDGVRHIRMERWAHGSVTVHPNGSGTLATDIYADQLEYLAAIFLGLGGAALVTEPLQLVELIKQRWLDVKSRYNFETS